MLFDGVAKSTAVDRQIAFNRIDRDIVRRSKTAVFVATAQFPASARVAVLRVALVDCEIVDALLGTRESQGEGLELLTEKAL